MFDQRWIRTSSSNGAAITPAIIADGDRVAISEYRYHRRVQFADTDQAGVVHFSWFARYMEEAEHALWREAGLSIAPRGQEAGFPRVAFSVEFKAPLHFEDEFVVHVRID